MKSGSCDTKTVVGTLTSAQDPEPDSIYPSYIPVAAGEKLLVLLLEGSREHTSIDKATSKHLFFHSFCFAFFDVNWVMSEGGNTVGMLIILGVLKG